MTPKEIGRLAGNIFRSILPPNWAMRSQEDQEDYGIDYEVELTTPDDQATGFIFKVQQKGALELSMNAAGDTISFTGMEVKKIRYYLDEVRIPIIFVLVDVTKRHCYWCGLQGNPRIEADYREAVATSHETMTLHIPVSHRLPDTANLLLEAVSQSQDTLVVRGIHRLSSRRLLDAAASVADFDGLAQAVQRHHEMLRCEQIERLLHGGREADAFRMAHNIFQSASESVEMRFAAGLNIVRIQGGVAARRGDPNRTDDLMNARLSVATTLLQITRPRSTAGRLRVYARFLIRSARLRRLIEDDLGVFMSRRVQTQTGDALSQFLTQAAQRRTTMAVSREFYRTQLDLVRIIRAGHLELLPQVWSQFVQDASVFLARLRYDGHGEAANDVRDWLDAVGEVAFRVAVASSVWTDVGLCAFMQVSLADPENSEDFAARVQTARERAGAIGDAEEKAAALEVISNYETIPRQAESEPPLDEEIRLHRQMARSLGVDLDDPNDEISQIVNIGLRDLNPERVLKNCQHLFVSLGFSGVPAQMLGLPTAGSKWLHCTKTGYAIMGMTLDGVYETFRDRCCRDCQDRVPHPADWKWSRRWQQEQDQQHKALAEQANLAFDGPPHSDDDGEETTTVDGA